MTHRKMTDFDAVRIVEGAVDGADPETMIEAWQHLVDTGLAWSLQGSFGRGAKALIEQGVIRPPAPTGRQFKL